MTPAENISRVFGGEFRNGQGFIPTPGHSARDRGTTVRDADDGDVVFASFNGGDWREMKDECRRRGLLPERERAGDGGGWRETARFEYFGADGAVAYRTVRKEKPGERKRFVAQRPDGRGGWANGLGDAERVLYRLPDIIAADPATIVYLAEGERKADKLASWGLLGTAIAFGARGWRDSYAAALSGRTVAILPDNDDEGRGFAERAAASIRSAGGRVAIVELPGLPPKGDVIDWTGTADELRALVDMALYPPVPTLALLDPGAWQGQHVPARQWALYEMILVGQVTYLTGAGASGKSLLGQQLATCIALGRPFLGVETREGVALYVTCEDDADELHRRQAAIYEALSVPLAALSGKLHLASLAGAIGNELATFDVLGRMATTPAWERLRATVLASGATFIVLDNVAHLFAGNENIRNQVAAFLSLLNGLAAETGAAVLLIGHPNKAGDSYSGSTAWENQVRSRLFLERPRDPDGSILDPDARTLSRGKANYARNGDALAFRWHRWAFVRDEDLPANVGAEIAANVAAAHDNSVFLACLDERNRQERAVSENKASRTYAPKEFAGMAESKSIGRARLECAMDRLFRLGAIERGFLWRDGGEGKDRIGLRRAADDGRKLPADLSADLPPTRSDDVPLTARRPPLSHTPSTTYYPDAATEAAASGFDEDDAPAPTVPRSSRGVILAPGETGEEPVPGWEDEL